MKENEYQVLFAGNLEKVKRFRKRATYWLILLLILTVPIFCYDLSFDKLSPNYIHFFDYILFPVFGICLGAFIFSTFALLPQNFEIRENGITLPTRGYIDGLKRRERFIKFRQIANIKIGENALHHEIILKNGKTILLGLGGAFFLSLSVPENKMGKMEKVLRKVNEELAKYHNHEGEIVIKKEQIGMD